MRLLAYIGFISLITVSASCSGPEPVLPQSDTNPVHQDTVNGSIQPKTDTSLHEHYSTPPKSEVNMHELLESFMYCRENSENSLTCKYFIAKAINQYFGIKDFLKPNGEFMDFEQIHPFVQSSPLWEKLGNATEQTILNDAQEIVNHGRAVIAISENDLYGHVVILLPGELTKAPAWNNLNCPDVASFFMIPGLQPFVEKSIAYAWARPDGIVIYARKS